MYVSWIKRYKNLISQLSPPKFRYFEDQNRPKGDPWKWILTNSKCKNEVPNQLGLERQMKKIGSSILLSYLRCGLRSLNCQKLRRFCNFLLILAKILDCSSNLCIYIYIWMERSHFALLENGESVLFLIFYSLISHELLVTRTSMKKVLFSERA